MKNGRLKGNRFENECCLHLCKLLLRPDTWYKDDGKPLPLTQLPVRRRQTVVTPMGDWAKAGDVSFSGPAALRMENQPCYTGVPYVECKDDSAVSSIETIITRRHKKLRGWLALAAKNAGDKPAMLFIKIPRFGFALFTTTPMLHLTPFGLRWWAEFQAVHTTDFLGTAFSRNPTWHLYIVEV